MRQPWGRPSHPWEGRGRVELFPDHTPPPCCGHGPHAQAVFQVGCLAPRRLPLVESLHRVWSGTPAQGRPLPSGSSSRSARVCSSCRGTSRSLSSSEAAAACSVLEKIREEARACVSLITHLLCTFLETSEGGATRVQVRAASVLPGPPGPWSCYDADGVWYACSAVCDVYTCVCDKGHIHTTSSTCVVCVVCGTCACEGVCTHMWCVWSVCAHACDGVCTCVVCAVCVWVMCVRVWCVCTCVVCVCEWCVCMCVVCVECVHVHGLTE